MKIILELEVGPSERAERAHGSRIVEESYDTADGPEALFFVETDPQRNAIVDAERVADDILDLFRTWGGADALWTVTAYKVVEQ